MVGKYPRFSPNSVAMEEMGGEFPDSPKLAVAWKVASFPAPLPAAILFSPGRWVWYLSAESLDVNLQIRGNQSDCRVVNIMRKSHGYNGQMEINISVYYLSSI